MFKCYQKIGIALITFVFASNLLNAQDDFASIQKNVNVLAKTLQHDLNTSKDTLILKGKNRIYRIYTVGSYSGIIDKEVNGFDFEIPLTQLRKGLYTFAVDQRGKKIVFKIHIHRNINQDVVSSGRLKNKTLNTIALAEEKSPEVVKIIPKAVKIRPKAFSVLPEETIVSSNITEVALKTMLLENSLATVVPRATITSPDMLQLIPGIEIRQTTVQNETTKLQEAQPKSTNPFAAPEIAVYKSQGETRAEKLAKIKARSSKMAQAGKGQELKSYNITDVERKNMQTREDAMKERELKRVKKTKKEVVSNNDL